MLHFSSSVAPGAVARMILRSSRSFDRAGLSAAAIYSATVFGRARAWGRAMGCRGFSPGDRRVKRPLEGCESDSRRRAGETTVPLTPRIAGQSSPRYVGRRMVRVPGVEPGSSASEADTLSIVLHSQKTTGG